MKPVFNWSPCIKNLTLITYPSKREESIYCSLHSIDFC